MAANTNETITESYDEVPYESFPFPQSSPEVLQSVAYLFGLKTPSLQKARILELGCSAGGNIIPIAMRHPKASLLGVDLSSVQIAQGKENIKHLGLKNIQLKTQSISELTQSDGKFDYIICHGVYSWVPPEVQEDILRVCSENLSDTGVAYISYNVYPGWKSREIIRDAMMFRGSGRATKKEGLAYGRGMLNFLNSMAPENSLLKKIFDENLPSIQNAKDYYVIHEFLETCNAPCYFKDFVAAAATKGLTYLAESEYPSMFASNYDSKISEPLLKECSDQVSFEQYLDFVTNRGFRQTLLVKASQAHKISYLLTREKIEALHYSGAFTQEAMDGVPSGTMNFKTNRGASVKAEKPSTQAAVQLLNASFPSALSFSELCTAISKQTGESTQTLSPLLVDFLSALITGSHVRIHAMPLKLAVTVVDRPSVAKGVLTFSSLQQSGGAESVRELYVCNLNHEPSRLNFLEAHILALLDGKRTLSDLTNLLVQGAKDGTLTFSSEGKVLTEAVGWEGFARKNIPTTLESLRRKGLLAA